MGFKLTKELAGQIVETKVKFRSRDLKLMADFIVKEAGEEGYEKVKEVMERVGYPLVPEKIHKIHYSNMGIRVLLCLAAKEALGWDQKKFEEWGRTIPRKGMVIKFFSSVFRINREFFFKKVPRIFEGHIKNIDFEPVEANFEKGYFVFRINRFKSIPATGERVGLALYKGFFASWAEMVIGKEATCEVEVKKESYNFTVRW